MSSIRIRRFVYFGCVPLTLYACRPPFHFSALSGLSGRRLPYSPVSGLILVAVTLLREGARTKLEKLEVDAFEIEADQGQNLSSDDAQLVTLREAYLS